MLPDRLSTDQLLYLRTFRSAWYSLTGLRRTKPERHLNDPRLSNYPTNPFQAGLPPMSGYLVALLQGSLQAPFFLRGMHSSPFSRLPQNHFDFWPRVLARATVLRSQYFLVVLVDWTRRAIALSTGNWFLPRHWMRWVFHIWLGRSALSMIDRPIISVLTLILTRAFKYERRFMYFFVWYWRMHVKIAMAPLPPNCIQSSPSWKWVLPDTSRSAPAYALMGWKLSRGRWSTWALWIRLARLSHTLPYHASRLRRRPPALAGLEESLGGDVRDGVSARLRASFITISFGMSSFQNLCDR